MPIVQRISWTVPFCLLILAGCIPANAPKEDASPFQGNPESAPPVAEAAAPRSTSPSDLIPEINPGSAAAVPEGTSSRIVSSMDYHPPTAQDVGAVVIDLPNGEGYKVEGSYGLEGRITRTSPDPKIWTLEAAFNFDTTGYRVDDPVVMQMMDIVVGDGPPQFETEAGSYVITIPLTRPRADAPVEAVKTEVPVRATIHATAKPEFTVILAVQ